MRSQELLQHAAALMSPILQFTQTTEQSLAQYFRLHPKIGARERALLSDVAYRVVRLKSLLFAQLEAAPRGIGSQERKLALLGMKKHIAYFEAGLSQAEREWLAVAHQTDSQDLPQSLPPEQRHNLPEWLVQKLMPELGESFWPFAFAMLQPASVDLRVNVHSHKVAAVAEALTKDGCENSLANFAPYGLRLHERKSIKNHPLFLQGGFEVQDEGSQLIALLSQAKREELVVDFCAGAGGKTLAMASMMRGKGRVYALDASASRLEALRPRMQRAKLENIYPMAISAGDDERVQRLAGKADCVLVDAPCSGLGTLRRQPDLKWRRQAEELRRFQMLQLAILRDAARLLKPGGRLLYATCSVLREENEEVAQLFSSAHPNFLPQSVADILIKAQVPDAQTLASGGEDGRLYLRTWPHLHQMDGFFAAVWHKAK
jgi:16S rRNA (cytosine967-C5)-methyltransferase